MPAPSSSLATLRPDLEQSFTEFDLAMNMQGFIAQKICPVIDVMKASGNFGRIPIGQLLQNPDTARAPGSGYHRGKFTFAPGTFVTYEHGYEEPVDDNEAEMYSDYFDAEQISALRAHHALLLAYEQRVVSTIINTSLFTGGSYLLSAANKWSSYANATPMTDVETAIQSVWANSGLWPNCLILHMLDFRNLRLCQQTQDLIKFCGITDPRPGNITAQAIAQALGIDELIIAGSAVNTANDGQTVAISPVWTAGYAMVARVDRSPDFRRPTLARTFHWAEDGSTINGTVESYRDEPKRSTIIRVRHQTGEELMYQPAGFMLSNIR